MTDDGWDIPLTCSPDEISPSSFEQYVVEALKSTSMILDDFVITLHDRISGVDGTYDLDATLRFKIHGMQFVVVVEAKKYSHPIKRELVQVLHQKVKSVGAHKGLLISTSPYQSGARRFADAHGIALSTIQGTRISFVTHSTLGVLSQSNLNRLAWQFPYEVTLSGYFNDADEGSGMLGTVFRPDRPELAAAVLAKFPRQPKRIEAGRTT